MSDTRILISTKQVTIGSVTMVMCKELIAAGVSVMKMSDMYIIWIDVFSHKLGKLYVEYSMFFTLVGKNMSSSNCLGVC